MQAGYPEVVSSEIAQIRVPTASGQPEGNTAAREKRERDAGPAESKTPGMHGNFTRENRETPLASVARRTRTGGRRR